ncbi:MAG: glycosyl transferase family 2, partial [Coriobacteriia bacterium]|nr:glycosyl transferase family 2 [Coriobacteriia bacterium]
HVEWSNTEVHRDEWYINNVYRAYNFGATQARGDFVVFLNTDMGFSPGWFEALWSGYDGASALASRLVESGKLKTGLYGIEKDFGVTPDGYREHEFVQFAEAIREPGVLDGGLYMPLLIRREHFLEVGGYPEGNMQPGSDIFAPDLALPGEASISGDKVLIQRLQSRGITHRTALDSIVYHFQMGEKDDESDVCREARSLVAVCNDLVTGTMGERVLWDFLLEGLPSSVGVDSRTVGTGGRYSTLARDYIRRTHPQTEVIIQNATFIDIVDPDRYTIAFLQDDLRAMGRDSTQQERNLSASRVAVTNSLLTAISYPEYDFEIIPVGVDETLFRPLDKKQCREENGLGGETIGVFVGAFDEVKGWPEVRRCIDVYPEITWLLITKREESFEAANAKTYCRVSQERLVTLLNAADFFIVGS